MLSNYTLQLTENLQKKLEERKASLKVKTKLAGSCLPGVHIRRGDKYKYTNLTKYMVVLEEVFKQCEANLGKQIDRTFFLATDGLEVWDQIRAAFPAYTILGKPPSGI